MNKGTNNEVTVMDAIIANPGADNKKLVEKTKLGRETVRLTVKKLVASGKVIANTSGKVMTFIAKEKKTTAKKVVKNVTATPKASKSSANNDRSKMVFRGQEYGKGKLVLEVVRTDAAEKSYTIAEFKERWPDRGHRKHGIFQTLKDAEKKCTKQKRFFIREDQVINLKDGKIAVCSDWGSGNFEPFVRIAKQNGYTFTQAK